jgi:hypothetical protein
MTILIGTRPLPDPGSPERGTDPARAHEALDTGVLLHDLALSYWSQGRLDDAARIAHQAIRVLERHSPGAAPLREIRSTLRQIELELSETGI